MGDRLRFRTPSGTCAEPAAQLEELGRRSAGVVRAQTARRQEMAEGVAISTWHAGLSPADGAGAAARRAAVQRAGGAGSSISTVCADSRVKSRTRGSAACLAALCRAAANTGAARPDADGDANAFRIRRGREFAAACSGGLGIYATLCARPFRRGTLQYHPIGTITRPDSNDSPGTLNPQVGGKFRYSFRSTLEVGRTVHRLVGSIIAANHASRSRHKTCAI